MRFKDRKHAGEELAKKLNKYSGEEAVIFALPRGGVPVAAPIAEELDTEINLLIVRKLGFPGSEEVAMGAMAPDYSKVFDDIVKNSDILKEEAFRNIIEKEKKELDRRKEKYKEGLYEGDLEEKIAIIVDDGLATGRTMEVAVKYLKSKNPSKIVIAVPVCPTDNYIKFEALSDEYICAEPKQDFMAVGRWYEIFGQTSDEEVLNIIKKHKK